MQITFPVEECLILAHFVHEALELENIMHHHQRILFIYFLLKTFLDFHSVPDEVLTVFNQ